MPIDAADATHLRRAIGLSRLARQRGDMPYGAVLVAADGAVLAEANNTQVTEHDVTGHAELNLLREASRRLGTQALVGATVYASGEPCPMCAGAIYWSGARRVVFALDVATMIRLAGGDPDATLLDCRTVIGGGHRSIAINGPALRDEAEAVFHET